MDENRDIIGEVMESVPAVQTEDQTTNALVPIADIITENGITDDNAKNKLLEAFGAPYEEAGEILLTYKNIKVSDETDTKTMELARKTRLKLRGSRIALEKKRKELGEDYRKAVKVINAIGNGAQDPIKEAEAYLQSQEDYAKLLKEKELDERESKRKEEIMKLGGDPANYAVRDMSEVGFSEILALLANQKKVRDEQEAEQKKRDDEEKQRLADENAKLRAEQEERDKKEAERQKLIAQEKEEINKIIVMFDDIILAVTNESTIEEVEAIKVKLSEANMNLPEIRRQHAFIEAQYGQRWDFLDKTIADIKLRESEKKLKEKEDAEREAQERAEAAKKAIEELPDLERLWAFANNIEIIANQKMPPMKTEEGIKVSELAKKNLLATAGNIKANVRALKDKENK